MKVELSIITVYHAAGPHMTQVEQTHYIILSDIECGVIYLLY